MLAVGAGLVPARFKLQGDVIGLVPARFKLQGDVIGACPRPFQITRRCYRGLSPPVSNYKVML